MLEEMRDLGFESVELSHGIRVSLAPGILAGVEDGVARVSSVHNFCPLPAGVMNAAPNIFEPTARQRAEREAWRRQSCRTIDFARQVGAPVVVLHSGSIPILLGSPERRLKRLRAAAYEPGAPSRDPRYVEAVRREVQLLERRSAGPRRRALTVFRQVAEYARECGIRLAVENREGLREFPLDDLIAGFLDELDAPEVFGYWHDTGHAQLKELAGIGTHHGLLLKNQANLLGFHLHDVSLEESDHQIPGSGMIDWSMVGSFVRPEHELVLELSPRLSPVEVCAGRDYLLRRWG